MPRIIRLGDSTSHGGRVTSAASNFKVMGIAVARHGDKCSCPRPDHNNCTIAEGDPHHTIDGIPVAYEDHKTSCGASLVASVTNFSKA